MLAKEQRRIDKEIIVFIVPSSLQRFVRKARILSTQKPVFFLNYLSIYIFVIFNLLLMPPSSLFHLNVEDDGSARITWRKLKMRRMLVFLHREMFFSHYYYLDGVFAFNKVLKESNWRIDAVPPMNYSINTYNWW